MKITLAFTGKTEPGYLKEGIDIYIKRLRHYAPTRVIIIDDGNKSRGNPARGEGAVKGTIDKILASFTTKPFVVLMDEKGEDYNSLQFAEFIEKSMIQGYKELVFIIGGAYGFSDNLKSMATRVLSMSKMTFSHQMARLILAEQIYRAMTIIKGEPYHHE